MRGDGKSSLKITLDLIRGAKEKNQRLVPVRREGPAESLGVAVRRRHTVNGGREGLSNVPMTNASPSGRCLSERENCRRSPSDTLISTNRVKV